MSVGVIIGRFQVPNLHAGRFNDAHLETVFENGIITKAHSFAEIRARAAL